MKGGLSLIRSMPFVFAGLVAWLTSHPFDTVMAAEGAVVVNDAGPTRFYRLTEAQYRATIADIFGPEIAPTGRFEPDMRVHGLLATGAGRVSVTPGGAERYHAIAHGIAAQVVSESHRDQLIGCAPRDADPQGAQCLTGFFERIGLQLYRRPLSEAELALAVDSALASAETLGDFHAGLATSLAAMMTDLPFLFRIDHYVSNPEKPGTMTLDGWSRASRLSYLLWNTVPDDELLRVAQNGDLMTEQGLEKQIERMLASPRLEHGIRAFFADFLRLDDLAGVAKDAIIYPAYRSSVNEAAREQTLRTIVTLLVEEDGDYRDIFTSLRVAMNRTLSPLYAMMHEPEGWSMVTLDEESGRRGLLTHISFLAMHSHEGRSSPTLRGVAFREALLCEEIPAPPANVNFAIVQETSNPELRTSRERLQAHLSDAECASCHRKTDTVGLVLEQFDGAGQFRSMENGVVIDTSGDLDGESVEGPADLGEALRDHPGVTQCLIDSLMGTALGRSLQRGEAHQMTVLNEAFSDRGYHLRDLLRSIATHPVFLDKPTPDGTGQLARVAGATIGGL